MDEKESKDIKCNFCLQPNLTTTNIKGRLIMNFKTGLKNVPRTMIKKKNKKKQKQLLDSERAGELPIWTGNDINNLMQLNLHSLTLKINTNCWLRAIHCCWHWTSQKDIACFFPHLRRAINPYSIYRKWQRKKKKAITNFLHSTLQRGPKEPQDSIISVGFKREKWDDPYNAHNLFPLFLKNKINWKTICLNHSFGEFV